MPIIIRPLFYAVLLDLIPLLGLNIRELINPVPILLPAVVALLIARCVQSLAVIAVAVWLFFYELHIVLHGGRVCCCWLLLGPLPVVD